MSTNSPRIGTGAAATTSLGAVGGPRGVAAGGLRLIIELLTQYDGSKLKQLESDLKTLQQQDAADATREIQLQQRVANATAKINQINNITQAKFTRQQR